MAIRTNLVVNPNLETNATGYVPGTFSTLARSTADFRSGSASLLVTNSTNSSTGFIFGSTAGGASNAESIPVTAGQVVTYTAYVKLASGTGTVGLNTSFSTNGGTSFSAGTTSGSTAALTSSWQRLTVTATVPASATLMRIWLDQSGVSGSLSYYVDDVMVEVAAAAGPYFDGSSSQTNFAYAWTGTANASTSTETQIVRTNLVVNPNFETNTTGWVPGGFSTISRSTVDKRSGSASMLVANNSSNVTSWIFGDTGAGVPNAQAINVTAGQIVAIGVYVKSASTVGTLTLNTSFSTNGGTSYNSSVTSATGVATNGSWQRHTLVATVPASGTKMRFWIDQTSVTSGFTFYVDDALVEVSNAVGAYFDGSSTQSGYTYAWTGTSNASTSTETLNTGGSATASLGIGFQTGPVTLGVRAPLGINAQTGKVSLGVTARLGIAVGAAASSGGARTAPLGVAVAAGPTSLGVRAPLGAAVQAGPVALGVKAPLGVNVDADATAAGPSRTATLGVSVGTAAVANSRTAQTGINIDADANWTPSVSPSRTAALHIEIITPAEAFFTYPPPALGTTPLGKLVSFSVSTSAVPLNPAEGSGAAPSVSAGYIKGVDPEYALGETNVLSHGAVGIYEGEIVRLSLPRGSDVASVSQDTALTLLNNDLTLFPFIDAAPSNWTAARAIDYWSQQCGLFYDKVPGDCVAYASGYGHTDSYGAGTTSRFYEKLAGGTTATQVIGSRSVKTLGSAVTGTTAFHELADGGVPVSVPAHSKLVASIGLGLRGTGRTSTVTWNMLDAQEAAHTVVLTATSAGAITASLGGVPIASATVAPNGDYRITLSIEQVSPTAVVGKLTVHTDDLEGSGTLEYESSSTALSYALPTVLRLTSITHVSAGGSGDQMLRWGTYLTVAQSHPMAVPAVQKALSATGKEFGFVSGFEGNVWAMLNEYCAITRLDVSFLESKMVVAPRQTTLASPLGNFSGFSRDSERREKYKQVAVVNKQSRAVSTDDAVLWRADSVFQVAKREVFETTVQTPHSILNVVQPVAVDGIWPFPYTEGAGEYVVTGADGYIISPAWWNDNGGLVEVSLTGKAGEIAIKITAPVIDTVRAPYRISEGAADRPALYVSGSGILNDPKEVHVGTGAKNAKEGFDQVFESPFIAGPMETYDTAMAMASQYSASAADVSFEIPNDFYTPSRFGQFPAGMRFTDGVRNYRITDANQTHSRVSGNAVPHTTIGDYVASYPPGATIADEKARHAGRTIKQFNIKPLKGDS